MSRTPEIRTLVFHDIEAENCHVAACLYVRSSGKEDSTVMMEHVHVTYA
ncbi:MAG: hypothetical protein V8S27_01410 [Lachnospiraceae bacterium]